MWRLWTKVLFTNHILKIAPLFTLAKQGVNLKRERRSMRLASGRRTLVAIHLVEKNTGEISALRFYILKVIAPT
jgi:hypothetical protein